MLRFGGQIGNVNLRVGDKELIGDHDYFRASDSKIRFEVPALEGGIPKGLSLIDRASAIFLLIRTRRNRKKEAKLYRKIEAAIRADDQPALMILYAHLANLYQTFGCTATVIEVYKQILRLAERLHEWQFAAMSSHRAGICTRDLGMSGIKDKCQRKSLYDEAVLLHKKALDYAERAGDKLIMAEACDRLGDLCQETDPEFSEQMYARYRELMHR